MATAERFPVECPFWASDVTLGVVREGVLTYFQGIGDKKALIDSLVNPGRSRRPPKVLLFLAWTGQWKTNLYTITVEDLMHFRVEKI